MQKKVDLPILAFLNVLMGFVNIGLLIVFGVAYITWSGATRAVRQEAEELGMRVYCAKPPFTVFVDKDYPQEKAFTFCERGTELFMTTSEVGGSATKQGREVSVNLGAGFSASFVQSPGNRSQVRQLMVVTDNGTFIDINVDGSFDTRLGFSGSGARHEIRYQEEWREVARGHQGREYEMELQNGDIVRFDWESGRWLLLEEDCEPVAR
jgi:hypothetical protein